jgi:hypothetical protein
MAEIGNAVVETMSTAPSIDNDEVFVPRDHPTGTARWH